MGNEIGLDPQICDGDTTVVPGLIVKPDPDSPLQDLGSIAQNALTVTPNGTPSHYRFFQYSRADITDQGPSGTVPAQSQWAEGSIGLVSSSFPRLTALNALPTLNMANNATFQLWPSTSQVDRVQDGLRTYGIDERTTAGNALFSEVYNEVQSSCESSPLSAVPDVCDTFRVNVANQFDNCLASDNCGDRTSTWRNVGPGIAVSEQDIVDWDDFTSTPPGVYGYREPDIYVPSSFRHAYQWVQTAAAGSLKVKVVDQEQPPQPVQRATIVINDQVVGATDDMGQLLVQGLPAGSYDVEAENYTGPALNQPEPPPLQGFEIAALPNCTGSLADAPCQADNSACPPGFFTPPDQAGCTSDGTCEIMNSNDGTCTEEGVTCACYLLPSPPPSCLFEHGSVSATVTSGVTTPVPITLCLGTCEDGGVANGEPGACLQSCTVQGDGGSDCDPGLVCNASNQCVAANRIVQLSSPPGEAIYVDCNQLGQDNVATGLSFLCESLESKNCDPSQSPPNNTATWQICAGSNSCEVHINVTCEPDMAMPGGVRLTENVQLFSGCGSGAHLLGSNPDSVTNVVDLPPATPNNPNPTVCLDQAQSSPDPVAFVCFQNVVFPFSISPPPPCMDNEAAIPLQATSAPPGSGLASGVASCPSGGAAALCTPTP
jgi:hypothetical protein